ncbi:G patch domain-containing protein 4 [Amia ocellicauda]|uniref:G patch domain-containing protein 4 n=1 Tax=Amia ocellicauda TaxID=2972642 RepID=UPI003463B56E
MSEAGEGKSRGLRFAEQQMLRHGWEQGKGLGKRENGISEAIKVKVKCDKAGVGHNQADEFTFHWWDHVFNEASASLAVEAGEDGVQMQKVTTKAEGPVSNKRPRKADLAKAKLYGRFIKSATLLSGGEQPEEKTHSSADSSDSEDEDRRLDLSSATKLSDDDLVRVCGGRTAHKGARHGLKMSAKLARLEEQEMAFLAKYGKKAQSVKGCEDQVSSQVSNGVEEEEEEGRVANQVEGKKTKKKKKKRSKEREEAAEEEVDCTQNSEEPSEAVSHKKKKNRKREKEEDSTRQEQVAEVEEEGGERRKKKKKKGKREQEEEEVEVEEERDLEITSVKKKKKKQMSE